MCFITHVKGINPYFFKWMGILIIISNSIEPQLYFKNLLKSQKIEVHLRVETNVQWLTYYFESGNFNNAYKLLMRK